jgi:3-oxoacyl-[acyl-carrier protein] reductase
VKSLAHELGPKGITVNALAPGVVETPQALDPVNSIGPGGVVDTARQTPVRRVGQPADIAAAYLFLASEEAGYLTGQTIVIDGGRSLAHE